jgi:DnaJ family protein B protein 4
VEVTVNCSLKEFYNGAIKNLKYSRAKINMDGRTYREVEEEITVQVKPGESASTLLTFKGRGNEEYGHPRSCLVVKLA